MCGYRALLGHVDCRTPAINSSGDFDSTRRQLHECQAVSDRWWASKIAQLWVRAEAGTGSLVRFDEKDRVAVCFPLECLWPVTGVGVESAPYEGDEAEPASVSA